MSIISNWITLLVNWRTKAAPKIDKNESFGQLCQVASRQGIDKAMNDQQATEESNGFALRLDEPAIPKTFLETYSCNLEYSVLF